MLKRPQLILIDVDGTLVDSVPDLAYCIDTMLERLDRAPQGEAKVRCWVGNGVERLVCRALTGSMTAEPDEALFQRGYPLFLELYAENISRRSRLYPGVEEGLVQLKQAGFRLGCVTNKAEQFTLPLLQNLALRDYFEIVMSGDSLPKKKPDPLPLLYVADYVGVSASESLMVGDSMSDVKAARAAGFSVVCLSYGYNHGEDIGRAHPDAVIDSLTDLLPMLESA
ncbi:phosphoglycolate phosphatase [Ectothiorhodospiraceae bacterium BW-2]|nr:phosphoglycolate phosphatase [Ectothiorhodospiraceae bacterium BW-2]